ncbi:MAG: sugar transferase [Caldilineaceae bacterium]
MITHSTNYNMDYKVLRNLERFSYDRFSRSLAHQRFVMKLTLWCVRMKIRRSLKRMLDLTIALMAMPMLLPIMLLTALAIKLDSRGPVIFRQTRVGKWGQPFTCYKFRSMHIDAEQRKAELMNQNEADGPVFKMQNDPRVTRVGRIIRKLSIDELPQFFNVLKGDMSMVGPRPSLPTEVREYEFDFVRRFEAVPGITGLQQVSGRSDLDFQRWMELDLEYVAKRGIRQDIAIIWKTIPAVLFSRGAY